MSSTESNTNTTSEIPYSEEEQSILLDIAEQSIGHGLKTGNLPTIQLKKYSKPLQELRATFVTLTKQGELRGCIGTLHPVRPLILDVNYNAYAAAFEDPRFPPLKPHEKAFLELSISILSTPEPFPVESEQDLIDRLNPGVDGLILSDAYHRGTFLPSVWTSLPDPEQFVTHLKLKSGMSADYWAKDIKIEKYLTFSISR